MRFLIFTSFKRHIRSGLNFSLLITGRTSTKNILTCHWHAASRYAQSLDIQTVENNVQYTKCLGERFNANDVTNDSTRTKRPHVTTHGQDWHSVMSHLQDSGRDSKKYTWYTYPFSSWSVQWDRDVLGWLMQMEDTQDIDYVTSVIWLLVLAVLSLP